MSEITEEIRLVERIECAKEVKAQGDSYLAAAEQATEDGHEREAAKLFAGAEALYKVSQLLVQRSKA